MGSGSSIMGSRSRVQGSGFSRQCTWQGRLPLSSGGVLYHACWHATRAAWLPSASLLHAPAPGHAFMNVELNDDAQ